MHAQLSLGTGQHGLSSFHVGIVPSQPGGVGDDIHQVFPALYINQILNYNQHNYVITIWFLMYCRDGVNKLLLIRSSGKIDFTVLEKKSFLIAVKLKNVFFSILCANMIRVFYFLLKKINTLKFVCHHNDIASY